MSGVWLDSMTIWVSANANASDKLIAYTFGTFAQVPTKDITLVAQNSTPRGIGGNSEILIAADHPARTLLVYDRASGQNRPF